MARSTQPKQRMMNKSATIELPPFLAGRFSRSDENDTKSDVPPEDLDVSSDEICAAGPLGDEEKTVLLLTNAMVWCLLMTVMCVWQWKKRRNLRRRKSREKRREAFWESPSHGTMQMEHECLVAALQEELHAKSVSENEQAILWRQEKRILQSRIDELLKPRCKEGDENVEETKVDSQLLYEAKLLQQVKELEETVAFLTDLTESQTEALEAKDNEINKLHNILEEMQRHLVTPTKSLQQFHLEESTDDASDLDDSDAGSIGIQSSAEGSIHEIGHTRLQKGYKVVLLVSSMPGNLSTSMHQSRLEGIFRHGLQLQSRYLEIIDGCDPSLKLLRNDLFEISTLYAVYPQVFLVKDGDIQFVGDYETVKELHDARELPQRIGMVLPDEEEKENSPHIGITRKETIAAILAR